jgi:hypothetical protein
MFPGPFVLDAIKRVFVQRRLRHERVSLPPRMGATLQIQADVPPVDIKISMKISTRGVSERRGAQMYTMIGRLSWFIA